MSGGGRFTRPGAGGLVRQASAIEVALVPGRAAA
jgi:hypothetical protein